MWGAGKVAVRFRMNGSVCLDLYLGFIGLIDELLAKNIFLIGLIKFNFRLK